MIILMVIWEVVYIIVFTMFYPHHPIHLGLETSTEVADKVRP